MQYREFLYTLYDKYTYFIDLSHARAYLHARAKSFLFFFDNKFKICCQIVHQYAVKFNPILQNPPTTESTQSKSLPSSHIET